MRFYLGNLGAILVCFTGAGHCFELPDNFTDELVAEFSPHYVTGMEALPTGEIVAALRSGEVFIFDPETGVPPLPVITLPAGLGHEGGGLRHCLASRLCSKQTNLPLLR